MNSNNPSASTNQINPPSGVGEDNRKRYSILIIRFVALVFFIGGTSIFLLVPDVSNWKFVLLGIGLDLIASVMLYLTSETVPSNQARVNRFLILFLVGMGAIGLFVTGASIITAVICIIFTILISSVLLSGQASETSLTYGLLTGFAVALGGIFMENEQIILPFFQVLLPPILGVLILSYMVMLTMGIVAANLRVKLIVITLLMVIFPLLVLSVITSNNTQSAIADQRNNSLQLAAERTGSAVDTFINTNLEMITEDSKIPTFQNFLKLTAEERNAERVKNELALTISVLQKRNSKYTNSYALLDETGTVLFDTDETRINTLEGRTDYFLEAFTHQKAYVSNVTYVNKERRAYFYFSSPIVDNDNNSLGLVRVRFNADALQAVLEENINLAGAKTYPILLDEYQIRLADAYNRSFVFTTLAPISISLYTELINTGRLPNSPQTLLSTNMIELAANLGKNPETKFYTAQMLNTFSESKNNEFLTASTIKNKPWTVLYTQPTSVSERLSKEQSTLSLLIATVIAGLATIIATILSRTISDPVVRLTQTAEKIVAGDLTAKADITTTDEVGELSNMFNAMTAQLRHWISGLEERVQERTYELDEQNKSLAYRTRQIETIAEVARNISSTQDLESLLNLVTTLISERFGFYHVGIFLVDESKQYARLLAANSQGGKVMLARQHTLRVGQVGIVGFVTGQGTARIATDVGTDAVFFNNPDLPLTRSEMALPLKSGEEIIGALDVQSTTSNAFSDQDTELFATLADQISIGIINSRLLDDTNRALEEAQNIHRQYLRQEWVKQVSQQTYSGYQYTAGGTTSIAEVSSPDLDSIYENGEPVMRASDQSSPATLGIPIILKGEVIGAIQMQDNKEGGRQWNETEITAAQAVADQIAQALENARLFEQTVRRAERERKALEITSKIRATNDPQAMLEIAIAEVQKALGASRVQVVFPDQSIDPNGNHGQHSDQSLGLKV